MIKKVLLFVLALGVLGISHGVFTASFDVRFDVSHPLTNKLMRDASFVLDVVALLIVQYLGGLK